MYSLTDHQLTVPLDHDEPDGPTIGVFAREVTRLGGDDLPLLIFLQGGPGHESPRPNPRLADPPWLERALADFRVLFLDQRGTGLSTPFGLHTMAEMGDDPAAVARYLTHFRADAIVRDCEHFRRHLRLDRVSLLGQSFGGFTSLHYLSVAAESLDRVFFTGGLPPVGRHCDEVYAATSDTQRRKHRDFSERFPDAVASMQRAVELCDAGEVRLPGGQPLSARLLRTIGAQLGFSGGDVKIAHVLERDPRSPAFAADVAALLPFNGRNPLYAVIHESSYADGCTTAWSSERVMPAEFRDDPTLFTSEHIFPWHFVDDPTLTPYRTVAEILAQHPWPVLYDADALAAADVSCAAAIFTTDPFVDVEFSRQTASLLSDVAVWETDEHDHNALRVDGGRIIDRLLGRVNRR